MTRRVCRFLLCLLFAATVFLPTVFADDADFSQTPPDEYSEFLETIPEEIAELLPKGLFSDKTADIAEGVREMSGFSSLLHTLLSIMGASLGDCFATLWRVVGLLLLSAIFGAFRSSFRSESVGRAFSFASSLAILAALLTQTYDAVHAVTIYFERLNRLTGAVIPLSGALWAIGGNVTAATASSASLSIYLTVLEEAVGNSVVPFCGVCMAFTVVGTIDPNIRLGSLLASLKKHYTTFLAFLMTILLAMLGFQTTLAARADSLAMRGVKFAAGNLIPVVGGSVSELLRTVSAGVSYLRGTVGICALLLTVLSLFPMIARLWLSGLTWQLAAALADLLGCSNEKKLLDETASLCGYLLAAACICSSVLFLAIVLLVRCGAAVG